MISDLKLWFSRSYIASLLFLFHFKNMTTKNCLRAISPYSINIFFSQQFWRIKKLISWTASNWCNTSFSKNISLNCIAKFEMNSRGGEIFLICLIIQPCAPNLCDWFSGSSMVFFIFCTNRAQSLYLVTAFPSSVHQFFFTHFTSILQMFSRPSYISYLIMFSFKFIFQPFYDQSCSYASLLAALLDFKLLQGGKSSLFDKLTLCA